MDTYSDNNITLFYNTNNDEIIICNNDNKHLYKKYKMLNVIEIINLITYKDYTYTLNDNCELNSIRISSIEFILGIYDNEPEVYEVQFMKPIVNNNINKECCFKLEYNNITWEEYMSENV